MILNKIKMDRKLQIQLINVISYKEVLKLYKIKGEIYKLNYIPFKKILLFKEKKELKNKNILLKLQKNGLFLEWNFKI